MSSGSHQGSPKPLAGAPRWQPLVFMPHGFLSPQPPHPGLQLQSSPSLPQRPIQQSPSRPPEGCPCHRQPRLQRPARLSTAGAAQTCWLLVQGTKLIRPSVEHLGECVYHGLCVPTWAPGWGPGGAWVTFTDCKDHSSGSHHHHCCWAGETTAQPGSNMLKLPGRVRG